MTPGGAHIDGKDTRYFFHMIPKSKITFSPPPPRFITEELTGASGELDHTEILTGEVAYDNRQGKLSFLVLNGSDYVARYKAIKNFFNGTVRACILDDDPEYTYTGRFYLSAWRSHETVSECEITYDLEPFRYSEDTVGRQDWLWDEMDFDSDDYLWFAYFDVYGQKARNLVNISNVSVIPTVICSAAMSCEMDDVTYFFSAGSTRQASFVLAPGDNYCTFYGTGQVRVVYPEEARP